MSTLELLLARADDGRPVVEALADQSCHGQGRAVEQTAKSEHLADDKASLDDLPRQRWGVIVPEGDRGEQLLRRVQPLIDKRREDQGGHEVVIHRVPPRMSMVEAAHWRKTVYDTGEGLQVDIPRYQLILGDLHEVPISLQLVQGMQGCVGRLAFDNDAHYERYVEKLLGWEAKPSDARTGKSVFHTVHDGSSATKLGYSALVEPAIARAREWAAKAGGGEYPAAAIEELGSIDDPCLDDLLDGVEKLPPSVLFTLSHGLGAPLNGWASDDKQRARQGAMKFGRDEALEAADIAESPFLPGGFWLMFACFGAGTPGHGESKFYHWLARLADSGQFEGAKNVLSSLPREGARPFIAALPKAALANPKGPLSFVGHVDLAWSYSFQPLDSPNVRNRAGQFLRILREPLMGSRAGVAMRQLPITIGAVETELASLADEDEQRLRAGTQPQDDPRRGHLWMLRQDLLGYVLLGDPAARLPLKSVDTAAKRASERPIEISERVEGVPSDIDIEELEIAIAKLIAGVAKDRELAEELGMTTKALRVLKEAYAKAGMRVLEAAIGGD